MSHPENTSRECRAGRVSEFERAYTAALLAGDEIAAENTIREAMDAGLNSAEIDEGVIAPALWLMGALWERGEISVADEHLATESRCACSLCSARPIASPSSAGATV